MNKIYVILFLIGTNWACSQESPINSDPRLISIDLENSKVISQEYFEILEIIPLETTSENLMTLDVRVRKTQDSYYIMDLGMRDAIHRFSLDGKYLGSAVSVGEGPDQVLGMQDFQIVENGDILILSSIGDQSFLYRHSITGNLTKEFDIDYLASSFTVLGSGNYLFSGGHNLPYVTERVILTDSTGKKIDSFLPNNYQNEMIPTAERNFYESENSILYSEIFNDTIYKVENFQLKPLSKMHFGKYSLPSDFWNISVLESLKNISEKGFAIYKAAFETRDYILFNIHIQKKGGSFKKLAIVNKLTRNTQILESTALEGDPFNEPIHISDNQITFFSSHSTVVDKLGKTIPDTLKNKLMEGKYDYPVMFKVKVPSSI